MPEQRFAARGTIPQLGEGWLPVSPTQTVVSLHLVRVSQVAALVPPGLQIVRVAPGFTFASTLLSYYGPESTLEYSEFVLAPALVRCGPARGFWVSHLWVDSADSVTGGRRMGLPKELARFDWRVAGRTGRCTLTSPAGAALVGVSWTSPRLSLRATLAGGTLSALDDGTVVHFASTLSARWSLARVAVELAASVSPAPLLTGRARVAVVSGPMRGAMGIALREVGRLNPSAARQPSVMPPASFQPRQPPAIDETLV